MSAKKVNLPRLQVCIIHGGAKCYWLADGDKPFGSRRYFHPDCEIWFKGARSNRTDHAVMLALQDAHMSARALTYSKIGG